jgi:hypothetical protein
MITKIPTQIQVQTIKAGWRSRSYQFISEGLSIGQLDFTKSLSRKATGIIDGKEFEIRRGGFWKHHVEIASSMHSEYNMRIDLNWRNTIKILDRDRNPYTFKSTSIWGNKWGWFNHSYRPLVEIKSNAISKKSRGRIEIKDPEMKDCLFWIVVSWFVILCSESDAAIVAAT